MPQPKRSSTQYQRDHAAHLAINALAAKIARAQAHDIEVILTLRTRPPRKLRGLIESRRIDRSRKYTGTADGSSNLIVRVGGEEIALERVGDIRRPAPG